MKKLLILGLLTLAACDQSEEAQARRARTSALHGDGTWVRLIDGRVLFCEATYAGNSAVHLTCAGGVTIRHATNYELVAAPDMRPAGKEPR